MEILGTVVNAVVVGVVGLVLAWMGKARFDALDRRIDRMEERLDSSINSLRSDLTQVALAVGTRPRAENA
ncbi:MAG: hypothetical protein ACRDH9_10135 [Actinomycetota bacterium]